MLLKRKWLLLLVRGTINFRVTMNELLRPLAHRHWRWVGGITEGPRCSYVHWFAVIGLLLLVRVASSSFSHGRGLLELCTRPWLPFGPEEIAMACDSRWRCWQFFCGGRAFFQCLSSLLRQLCVMLRLFGATRAPTQGQVSFRYHRRGVLSHRCTPYLEVTSCTTRCGCNLYNASLVDSVKVVCDRLAGAETDGTALICAVLRYSWFILDMKVQDCSDQ